MAEQGIEIKREKANTLSPRELVFKYLHYLPWLIISLSLMLILAKIQLRYSTPIYNVYGKLLVSPRAAGGGQEKFDDIFMMQGGSIKINDEIEIIKSRTIASRVIRALGLQTSIHNKGKIRSTILHSQEAPFDIDFVQIADSTAGFSVMVTIQPDGTYLINESPQKHYYGENINQSGFTFRLLKNSRDWRIFESPQFVISWQPELGMAAWLGSAINVAPVNDLTNVLLLSYATENTRLGVDIVNRYMYEYQQSTLEDKKQIAANTLHFIDDQLDTVRVDLGGIEGRLQRYRESSKVLDPTAQATIFFGQLSENEKAIREQGLKLKVIEYLQNYLSDNRNSYRMVPSMLGIDEPALMQQISDFNKLQLDRETTLKSVPAGNPIIQNIETGIEKLRTNMIENLRNVRQTQEFLYNDMARKSRETDARISTLPSRQKQLLEVTRQQNILQELYSYLLQKKLETSIASASTISNIKVVEPAMAAGQVSPNPRSKYILAILVGLGIPILIIFILEMLNDKVKSKSDIQQVTDAPILGEIGHAEDSSTLVVTRNNRKFLAEQFRIVRSNLQYILPKVEKAVLLVTSSFSGEGKSFVPGTSFGILHLQQPELRRQLEFPNRDMPQPKKPNEHTCLMNIASQAYQYIFRRH